MKNIVNCLHEPRFIESVTRCMRCEEEDAVTNKNSGIYEGLRIAAEIIQNFHKSGKAIGVDISVFGINELILAKAKEIEEGKG